MAEKRTGLGRGLDALLPGRQMGRQPSAVSHPQNPSTAKHLEGAKENGGHSGAHPVAHEQNLRDKGGAQSSVNGGAVADKDALAGARLIPVEAIERNPYQTRGKIDEAALAELAASIREQGVLQPILVREVRGVREISSQLSVVSSQGSQRQDGHQPPAVSHQQSQNLLTAKDAESAKENHNPYRPSASETVGQIVASPNASSRYQLMAGERRWLAAQRAGLKMIPAVVKPASDEQAMEITIIENLQREDLNPMEQARAFERLSREFALTQEQIAVKTGKDRASVANFVRLLKLPAGVQQHIEAGTLSLGHGKVLMMLQNEPAEMVERVAAKAAEQGTSVRELEELVLALMGPPKDTLKQNADRRDPNVVAAERELQSALGCKVKITDRQGKGKIVLEYATLEDFDRIVEVLGGK